MPERTEGRISKRLHIHNSIIHNNQKVEATQVSLDEWMGEKNMVYTYRGILLHPKKEVSPGIGYNMDEPWGHYAKWNEPGTR